MGDHADDALMGCILYELDDGYTFDDSHETAAGKKQTTKIPEGEGPCPKCGFQTVYRTGPFGKFWGCTRFPKCKGTRKWKSKLKD